MSRPTKQIVVIGSLAVALVIGVGVAVAGGGLGFGDQQTFLNDAAKRLNVTPAELKAALQGAYGDQLDAAVAAGKITQAQADAMKQRAAQGGGLPFFGGRHGGGFGHGGGASLTAAATYLGLTETALQTELASGKTLAQVATAQPGKTVDGLKQALASAQKAKLDAAVKAGTLTQAQADEMQAEMTSHLDDLVNGTRGPRGHFDGDGRGWGGPPPAGNPQAPAGFGTITPAGAFA